MHHLSLVESVMETSRRNVSGHHQIIAKSVKGLIQEAVAIIQTEMNIIGAAYLAERTERVTGVSITTATLKRWVNKNTSCPQLNKLNSVLNACGYQLMIGTKGNN